MLAKAVLDKCVCAGKSTKKMSRDKWLVERKSGIGGSDAGAIMGFNKWATPLTVYFSKISDEKTSEVNNPAIEWGNMAEDAIRRGIAKQYGLKIEKAPYMYRSIKHSFMIADLDGLVFAESETDIDGSKVEGLGGLEIKTTTRFNNEFSSDEIPDSYYCQVQHYMSVTGLGWFILAVMIDRVGGKTYVVPRNEEFIDQLVHTESVFWHDLVQKRVPPAPKGTEREMDLISSLPMAESVALDEEYSDLLNRREYLEAQIKAMKTESDALKERVLLQIASVSGTEASEKTVATCGDWKITYSTQNRKSADIKALEADGLEKYIKTSSSKVARFTRIKA